MSVALSDGIILHFARELEMSFLWIIIKVESSVETP